MKKLLSISLLTLSLAGLLQAQFTPPTANSKAFPVDPSTGAAKQDLVIPTGKKIKYESGATLEIVSGVTVTIPDALWAWAKVNKTGSSLADLATRSASDLSSGTLPDGRFPATLPVASGVNLTALNASNLSSGTIPDSRFPATYPAGSGVNLTAINASNLGSGTVPDGRFPATLPAASGINLTALNASNLGSGTVPDARLSSNVATKTYADAVPLGMIAFGWNNNSEKDGMRISVSRDGKNWGQISKEPVYRSPTNEFRDPTAIKIGDTYYVVYTEMAFSGTTGKFGLISSKDLVNWTLVAQPDMSSYGSLTRVYSPYIYMEPGGTDWTKVHVFVSLATGTLHETHPTNAAMTTWSNPVLVPGLHNEAKIFYNAGTGLYHAYYNGDSGQFGSTNAVREATSSTLLGTYTTINTNAIGNLYYAEQHPFLDLGSGHWMMWVDHTIGYNGTFLYGLDGSYWTESFDNRVTWSALAKCGDDGATVAFGGVLPVYDKATWLDVSMAAGLINKFPRKTFSNANYTMVSREPLLVQTGTMSAARTAVLPRAIALAPGDFIEVIDESGTVTATNKIIVDGDGSETINGSTTFDITAAYGRQKFYSNGSNKWTTTPPPLAASTSQAGQVTLASDGEIQTGSDTAKVVRVSGLAAWWTWIKTQAQTISGAWTFSSNIIANGTGNTMPNQVYGSTNVATFALADARYKARFTDYTTSDESFTSTTYANTSLAIAIPTTGRWRVRFLGVTRNSTSAPGGKFTQVFSGTLAVQTGTGTVGASNSAWTGYLFDIPSGFGGLSRLSGDSVYMWEIHVNVTATGTLTIQGAQGTADAAATVLKQGAFLIIESLD